MLFSCSYNGDFEILIFCFGFFFASVYSYALSIARSVLYMFWFVCCLFYFFFFCYTT